MDSVQILITSNVNTFGTERRFPKSITLSSLKEKLELLTGANANQMKLELRTPDDKFVVDMNSDQATLGSYPVQDGSRVFVTDTGHNRGEFEDVSTVPKFELKDEEYENREESLRAFKKKNKLGQFNMERKEELMARKEQKDQEILEVVNAIQVGNRCEVRVVGQPNRRGTVMFVGNTHFKSGQWVGVKLDEPLGKNDGSFQGQRYFECLPNYGSFVRPLDVVIGDFPEIMDMDEEL